MVVLMVTDRKTTQSTELLSPVKCGIFVSTDENISQGIRCLDVRFGRDYVTLNNQM